MSPTFSALRTRPLTRKVSRCGPVSMVPPGVVTFWLTMARCTSIAVSRSGAQPLGVEHHLDLSLAAADDRHLADARDVLQCLADLVVGVAR